MYYLSIDANHGTTSKDSIKIPIRQIIRARTRKFKDELNMIQVLQESGKS